jgi:regulator of sigma E protease
MSLFYFFATIILLVGIHEWGHFATARFFGVGVRSFTIGFGKQIFSWIDPKTGTSWGIAPFPVGGYVGLLGEKNNEQASQKTSVTGKSFMDAALHAKLLILFAGPFVNILFAALIYSVLAYSSPNPALPALATPTPGSQAAQVGLHSGDVLSHVNGVSVDSWRAVQTELLHLSSGQSFTLGTVGSSDLKTLQVPTLIVKQSIDEIFGLRLYSKGLRVQMLMPESAAARAGVQVDDLMVRVNGELIDHPDVLLAAVQAFKAGEPAIAIVIERAGQQKTIFVTPSLDKENSYRIGVQFMGLPYLSVHAVGPTDAVQEGLTTAYTASLLTVKALAAFLVKPFNGDQLAGPISIAHTAKASADKGLMALLGFVAGLSISVGILNLLPIPVLDGGQIVFHCVRSVSIAGHLSFKIKTIERLNQWWISIGIIFVVSLTLLAFLTDLKRLFHF